MVGNGCSISPGVMPDQIGGSPFMCVLTLVDSRVSG